MKRESKAPIKASRTCEQCGKPYTWRRKWARVWEEVKYCSERCRREAKSGRRMTGSA